MTGIRVGSPIPAFSLYDQHGEVVRAEDFAGWKLFVFFYPKAGTSG